MKKSIQDLLFDRKFSNEVSHNSLKQDVKIKYSRDSISAWAYILVYVLKFKSKIIPDSLTSEEASYIKAKSIEIFRSNNRKTKVLPLYIKLSVAVSLLLLFTVGGYWAGSNHFFMDFASSSEVIEFTTPPGEQSEIKLPDGTFVSLNYDSKIKYHLSDHPHLQEIELEGEAFFKVTKNKSRTFRVITSEMNVNVLGTEFNVSAYKNDPTTETTLMNGSVEIKDIPGQKESVFLKPSEKWIYYKKSGRNIVTKVDARSSTLWRSGVYNFDNVSLGKLLTMLERIYNVKIILADDHLKNEKFSGSVYRRDDIEKVMSMIKLTLPVNIIKKGDDFIIEKKY